MRIGDKLTLIISGQQFPGIVISEPRREFVTYASKDPARAGQSVNRPVERAQVVSYRTSREGVKYHTVTDEQVTGTFSVPRFNTVVGLDADENGEALGLQDLMDLAAKSAAALQAAREPQVIDLD